MSLLPDGKAVVAEAYRQENRWGELRPDPRLPLDRRRRRPRIGDPWPSRFCSTRLRFTFRRLRCLCPWRGVSVFAIPSMTQCYSRDSRDGYGNGRARDSAFSADGRYAAVIEPAGVEDRTGIGPRSKQLPQNAVAKSMAPGRLAVQGPRIAGGVLTEEGKREQIKLVELRSKAVCFRVACTDDTINPAPSSDGRMLAFTTYDQGRVRLEVWDTSRGNRVASRDGLPDWRPLAEFLANSDILATSEPRSGISFSGVTSWKLWEIFEHPKLMHYRFAYAGDSLVIGTGGNTIETWDLNCARLGRKGPRNPGSRAGAAAATEAEARPDGTRHWPARTPRRPARAWWRLKTPATAASSFWTPAEGRRFRRR